MIEVDLIPITFGASFSLSVYDPCNLPDHQPCPNCSLVVTRKAKNLMTTVGLAAIAQALNWSGVFAQNSNMGSPFSQFYLGQTATTLDLYAAVGTGSVAPAASDLTLTSELARSVVSAASFSTNQVIWSFFYGIGVATGTINEIGVFAQATSSVNNGTLLDHATISPGVTVTTTQTATVQAVFQINQG